MIVAIASLVVAVASSHQQAPPPPPPRPPVVVQTSAPPPLYNPEADPKAQIATALGYAKEDGIRVLLNFGSNDDESSKAFAAARRNRDLSRFFADEYRTVNIYVGALDKNLDVAQAYGVALEAGKLPALAVLDAGGKVIAQASGPAFRSETEPAAHDPAKIADFLTTHEAPPPPDAEPVFDAAVQQAKREGKTLFVWFSAPW
jgi:hypothetical protein